MCGRIRGYQLGATIAFGHICTFAAGLSEVNTDLVPTLKCPCDIHKYNHVPTFIGDNYFCESGLHSTWSDQYNMLYTDDVLWDGQKCTSTSTCCQLNNPPWFTKNLTNATTDDIELRLCTILITHQKMMMFPLNSSNSMCSDIITDISREYYMTPVASMYSHGCK